MKSKLNWIQVVLGCFFLFAVIGPLLTMFLTIDIPHLTAIFSNKAFKTATYNSVVYSGIAAVLSIILGGTAAWCLTRSKVKFKSFFILILTIPMLIPSISHGTGLVILLGANGILTNLLGLKLPLYGGLGIILGSIMYSLPVAFLMFYDILKYEDALPYDMAEILGVSKLRQFKDLTLPYLYKPLISIIFAIFTLIVTDYGVPLTIGGHVKTLPVMMYEDVIGLLDFVKGSVIGTFLLLPAVVAFVIDLLNKGNTNASYVKTPFRLNKSFARECFSYLYLGVITIIVLLPVVTFAFLSFVKKYPMDLSFTTYHIHRLIEMEGLTYLGNSFIIAVSVAVIGTLGAFATAYLSARIQTKTSYFLHLMTITSLAIPGLVLGLSYVLFFNGTMIYGTLAMLILVNIVHFFASPYLIMYNTLNKVNRNLEDIGMILGISRFNLITHVIIPQVAPSLKEMAVYLFVNSMMTISAVSFLSNVATKPIALMITQFEAIMMLECTAVVSLIILGVNIVVRTIALRN